MTPPPKKRKRSDAPAADAAGSKNPRHRRRRSKSPPAASPSQSASSSSTSPSSPPPSTAPSTLADGAESADVSDTARAAEETPALRIRHIEERLDRMIDERARERDGHSFPASEATSLQGLHGDLAARDPFSPDFRPHEDTGPASGTPGAAEDVDEFGYDPAYERKLLPFFELLYEKYFRVETHGIGRVPGEGRCLLVANHSGTLPIDGLMLRLAVGREHPQRRGVRWLAEDGIFHFPFLGNMTNRVGAVRACQENAERLLENESLVAVFPEGQKGIGKLFRNRYRLQRFGRGGFVKLCLRTRTPIVPVAIVGGEETNPVLARVEYLTKALGIPFLPVTPTFPLLGPAGLLPAPTKWKIFFGEPIGLAEYAPASADDEILVGRLTERVRSSIQAMLDTAVAERRSVWFG